MLYINRLTGRLEYMPEVIASGVGYVHPLTHPASMIVEETNRRFMTDAEKAKLAGIADGANNYIHPASHPASMVVEETDKRFMTDAERTKLTGIAVGATSTPLGNTAPAALATSGSAGASGTASRVDHVHPLPSVATPSVNGLMASSDKSKLDGVAAGANNYVHPASHPASMVIEDSSRRFMTDNEKTKLAGVAESANNYVHPASHPASIVTEDTDKRFMTDAERTKLASVVSGATNTPLGTTTPAALAASGYAGTSGTASRVDHVHPLPAVATSSANGLMASSDKSKLDGIAAGANNYVHPASHPASMVAEETDKRFMTDVEKMKLAKSLTMTDGEVEKVMFFDNPNSCYISIGCADGTISFRREDTGEIILSLVTSIG
ncbi:MAG TPA: hypothetical protein VMV56_06005 [Williamwhitmania sp.]|nr:hypothetical protein [Williamwhitmania sp.]